MSASNTGMHDHDLDLIAALAEGSLDDADLARTLVDTCDECRAEYESQLAALAYIASAPRVEMSQIERAALHRDLWAELRSEPSRPAVPWWYRWSYAAAGLFVVIGLVAVLSGQLRFPGGDMAEDAQTFSEIGSGLDSADDGGGEMPLSGAESDTSEEATTTMAASAETLSYPFADLADEARVKRQSTDPTASGRTEEIEDCLETLDLADLELVDILDLEQRYLVLMTANDESATVTFVSFDSCEIAHVEG